MEDSEINERLTNELQELYQKGMAESMDKWVADRWKTVGDMAMDIFTVEQVATILLEDVELIEILCDDGVIECEPVRMIAHEEVQRLIAIRNEELKDGGPMTPFETEFKPGGAA